MDPVPPAAASPLDSARLLQRALKLLASRDYAEKELRAKLQPRAAAVEDLDGVLQRLRELGFLNESRFAERKAADAAVRRVVGRRRAEKELEERELDPATIARAVEVAYEGREESAMALEHLERRLSAMLSGNGLEEPGTLQRAYRKLRRAGFDHAACVVALRAHSRLAADLDEFAPDDEAT
ncbi:MAG: RecX family transcriptional regulator [Bryobacterales bacterium]|nr:RecX family transcriptional regulator [Bryobacterales bacterium]